jgi:aspartate aminotransferase-like enzyme
MYDVSALLPAEFDDLTGKMAALISTAQSPVIIPGEAILGIEAVAAGISSPGRKFLNIVTGPYGRQFGSWLKRGGADVVNMSVPYDSVVSAQAVADEIERTKPCAVAFVQAEAVTGGSNPTREILSAARQAGIITAIDSVSAVGAEPVPMDDWGMDFVCVGLQKAVAGSNGISAVGVSQRGWEFIESNADALRDSALSLVDMKPAPGGCTRVPPNVSVLEARAAIESITRAQDEGFGNICRRHTLASRAAIAAIKAMGLEPWQRDPAGYSPLVTTVRVPQGAAAGRSKPCGILAPGDGELFGKLMRINHYGRNARRESVAQAVKKLAELFGRSPEAALSAVDEVWESGGESL